MTAQKGLLPGPQEAGEGVDGELGGGGENADATEDVGLLIGVQGEEGLLQVEFAGGDFQRRSVWIQAGLAQGRRLVGQGVTLDQLADGRLGHASGFSFLTCWRERLVPGQIGRAHV